MKKCNNCDKYYDESINIDCPYCEKDINSFVTMAHWVEKESSESFPLYQSYSEDVIHKSSIELKEGSRFGNFIINHKLGSGGFSSVYKVTHKSLNHVYALKVFENPIPRQRKKEDSFDRTVFRNMDTAIQSNTDNIDIQELKMLFFQEARNLANLTHPNVVNVFDEGVLENRAYILLEYIDTTRLDKILKDVTNFTINKTLDLLEDISSVLVEQEEKNIIHGDIKPKNIFLRKNNTFCLIDYGNMNSQNIRSYTKEFTSPEQIKGKITHQSDLFSLGLTAWNCLTGETPKSLEEWNFKIPPLIKYRTDLPFKFIKIIDNLLQIELSQRYKNAKDFLFDVQSYKYDKEEPIGTVRGSIFIAISYDKKFTPTYNVLNKIAKSLNYKCVRMDKLDFKDEIWKNIALEIENSDIMIADFSNGRWGCNANANVITEASHARAVGKKIIIITQDKPEDLPFDWRYLPTIKYSPTKKGFDKLSKQIYDKLRVLNI
jgi:serine/threonine protein kinase